jgi:anti-sigma factor RsiW
VAAVADREFAGLRCADILEVSGSFVLGALPDDEAAAVRRHLAACPEAHAEVADLGGVVPALFETVEVVEPPPGLKARILAAAAAETQRAADSQRSAVSERATDRQPAIYAARPAGAQRTTEPYGATDTGRRGWDFGALFRRPIWAGVAAAAVAAVIALGAWNLQLSDELAGLTAYRAGVVEVLEEAARPGAQLAVLKATEGPTGPTGLAAVGADGSVALVMRDLAPTSGTQVYETWLIGADGNPIPIGSFTVDASRTASFTTARASLGSGITVALSLEPQAGATTPTVVVAAGTASPEES